MDATVLRKTLYRRPWHPVDLVIASGDRYRVGHPEHVWVVPGTLAIADENGLVALLDPEAVVAVEPTSRRPRAQGRRGA